jgi:sugar phosphate isomerase/epimerase
MQLGIHIRTFRRPTLAAALDAVAAHRLKCVHFNLTAMGLPSLPERIDESLSAEVAREMAARNLRMATLSGTFNMIHPNPAVRRGGLRRLAVIAAAARPLGAAVIALCTGSRDPENMWRRHPENDSAGAWADLLSSMSEALAIAQRHDVTLAIEPEVANVVDSAAKARQLLNQVQSPRLKIIMDAANLFHAGELPRMHEVLDEAFALLGGDIVAAHAKDLDRDGEAGQLAAGKGVLDYDRYLGLLRKVGFDGPLILHGLAEDEVPGCVRFLREKGIDS